MGHALVSPEALVTHPSLRTWSALLLILVPGLAAAGTHAPGAVIENAAVADITPEGFEAITGLLPGLIPSSIDIPSMSESSNPDFPECLALGYEFTLSNGKASVGMNSAHITPQDGYLAIDIDLTVAVNSSSDPMSLYVALECLGDECDAYVDPFTVHVTTTLALDVVEGADGPVLDATVGDIALDLGLTGDQIHLDNCAIGTVLDVLDFFGLNILDLILSFAEPYLLDAVAAFGPEIETLIEDAFGSATISQSLDVSGILLNLELYPADIEVTPAGARLTLDGSMGTDTAAECVSAYDPGGSLATITDPPEMGTAPTGVDSDYHLGVNLSDDIGNQALYALWRGGMLCQTVDEELTGFGLSTDILGSLTGNVFDDLFPDSVPVLILTRPEAAPLLQFATENDLGVHVDDLGLDIYADVAYRQTKVVGINLDVDAGVNLNLDATTGTLNAEVILTGEDLVPTVVDNEFHPDDNATVESSFQSSIGGLIEPILSGLVSGLAVAMPAISGYGLTDLQLAAAGADQDWLGAYVWLGPVTYTSGDGCGGCGGDTSSCSSGCGTTGVPGGHMVLFTLPVALLFLRRRS